MKVVAVTIIAVACAERVDARRIMDITSTSGTAPTCTKQNVDKYAKYVRAGLGASTKYWDSCAMNDNGNCPDTCDPYAESTGLSTKHKAWAWMGRWWSGACEKKCRYKDDYMLQAAETQEFLATSLAVLEYKVKIQAKKCKGYLLSPSCDARQKKISSLTALVMKAANRATEAARAGKTDICMQRLPHALGQQLSDILEKQNELLQGYGQAFGSGLGDGFDGLLQKSNNLIRTFKKEDFCQHISETQGASPDSADGRTKAQEGLAHALEDLVGKDKAQQLAKESLEDVTTGKEAQDIFDEKLKQEEHKVETLLDEASGSSLVELGQQGVQSAAVAGILSKIAWGIVAFILHATLGTIFGVFMTALCWLSFGSLTNGSELTNIGGASSIFWLLQCPFEIMPYFWGITGDESLFKNLGD